MIKLNDAKQFEWTINYGILSEDKGNITPIAEGKVFDFIPSKGDIVILEGENYVVVNIIYDFDNSTITVVVATMNTVLQNKSE